MTLTTNMLELPGGTFRMGSDRCYPEERPVREVSVRGFWIDRNPVTVAEFRRFVKETEHVTWAEHAPKAADYPVADPESLVPGSLVTSVLLILTVLETPFQPFIALVVLNLKWNCLVMLL